jgi:hypothetical protein
MTRASPKEQEAKMSSSPHMRCQDHKRATANCACKDSAAADSGGFVVTYGYLLRIRVAFDGVDRDDENILHVKCTYVELHCSYWG